ncbi:F-box domain [Macleaya cordata]|uniref:F-box domain n=1 Tax=Macleaya cordata TaxID=56857 RepID=A0A200R9I1_MACCD|nr:F-box domain [Macleaya cordata]
MDKRRKRLKAESKHNIRSIENLLPDEIIIDIFSRLPFKSVLECRRVCKTWRTLIYNPSFARLYLRRSRPQLLQLNDDDKHNYNDNLDSNINGAGIKLGLGLLFLIRLSDKDKGNVRMYYGEYDNDNIDEQYFSYKTLKKINHPPINKPIGYVMVGSCNGLICFSVHQYPIFDPIYICNPITREYVLLPTLEKGCEHWKCHMVSGFGFEPSSNEYKVVRINYHYDQSFGRVEVYTLGSGNGWRDKGKISWSLSTLDHEYEYPPPSPGIFSNGSLYWLNKEMMIVAFDLADEEFCIVTPPPCFLPAGYDKSKHCFQLQELGGSLCVVHQERGERVDIWSLKKTKNTTSNKMNEKEENGQAWTWNRELSITWEGQHENEYEPFAFTKSGEVLLWYNHRILARYDPKTSTLKKLVEDEDIMDLRFFKGILHMNSFVSLKAIGEKCKTRRRYLCKDE